MMQTTVQGRGARGSAGRHWTLAFAGFLLLLSAWSIAAPYDGTPDEREHVIRAAGVAEGQIAPAPAAAKNGSGAFQTVPRGLVREQCFWGKPQRSASCAKPPSSDNTPTLTGTGAGRYQPVYYALVGWPLVLWPGWSGILLARLVSAVICAALLASAYVVIMRWSRRRLMIAGLLAATTPMAVQMGSAVNPSGPEIAAGIAFFTALIPLMVGPRTGSRRGLLLLVGLSGLLLAMLRQTGPLWMAIGLLALAFPMRHSNLRSLLRDRVAWLWTALISVATVASVIWIVVMKTSDLGIYGGTQVTKEQAVFIEAELWRQYLDEMVGVTSWLDTHMPASAYMIWEFVAAGIILAAVVSGRRLDRWRLLVLAFGGVVVPSALQVEMLKKTGWITQGRYMLPILAGLLLYAAWTLEEQGLDQRRSRAIIRLTVCATAPIQLLCLVYTMVRWQRGLPAQASLGSLNPLAGDWHPVLGSVAPLVAAVAGVAIIGCLAWTAPSRSLAVLPAPSTERTEIIIRTTGEGASTHHQPSDQEPPYDNTDTQRIARIAIR
jgi:hypothetical protein